jgi:hypothetical protein
MAFDRLFLALGGAAFQYAARERAGVVILCLLGHDLGFLLIVEFLFAWVNGGGVGQFG